MNHRHISLETYHHWSISLGDSRNDENVMIIYDEEIGGKFEGEFGRVSN